MTERKDWSAPPPPRPAPPAGPRFLVRRRGSPVAQGYVVVVATADAALAVAHEHASALALAHDMAPPDRGEWIVREIEEREFQGNPHSYTVLP